METSVYWVGTLNPYLFANIVLCLLFIYLMIMVCLRFFFQLFQKSAVNLSKLCDLIISQPEVSTVIKVCQ